MKTFQQGLADIASAATKWRQATADNLTGVGDVLSTLASDSHVTATEIHRAFAPPRLTHGRSRLTS